MVYRDQAFVLEQRLRDVHAERDELVVRLAALRPPAWRPTSKRPTFGALVGAVAGAVIVTLASLPLVAQVARVELVMPSGQHAFLFSGRYGTEHLTINLGSERVVSSVTWLDRKVAQ